MVSLFNGISTFVGYLMPKPFSEKNIRGTFLTHRWEYKGVHTFPKGICPKVNVIARLGFELAYYDSVSHLLNHYATRTPPSFYFDKIVFLQISSEEIKVHKNELFGVAFEKERNVTY